MALPGLFHQGLRSSLRVQRGEDWLVTSELASPSFSQGEVVAEGNKAEGVAEEISQLPALSPPH